MRRYPAPDAFILHIIAWYAFWHQVFGVPYTFTFALMEAVEEEFTQHVLYGIPGAPPAPQPWGKSDLELDQPPKEASE